jgi:hypothetical protein
MKRGLKNYEEQTRRYIDMRYDAGNHTTDHRPSCHNLRATNNRLWGVGSNDRPRICAVQTDIRRWKNISFLRHTAALFHDKYLWGTLIRGHQNGSR